MNITNTVVIGLILVIAAIASIGLSDFISFLRERRKKELARLEEELESGGYIPDAETIGMVRYDKPNRTPFARRLHMPQPRKIVRYRGLSHKIVGTKNGLPVVQRRGHRRAPKMVRKWDELGLAS